MGRKVKSRPQAGAAAVAFVSATVQAIGLPEKADKAPREPYRRPCAWGACKATFLPHSIGRAMHGACADGSAVMRAEREARAAGQADAFREALVAKLRELDPTFEPK